MGDVCICSPEADTGCRICNPDKWEEYHPNTWRVKKENPMDKAVAPESVNTRLLNKNYSPLIVRKYQFKGWPMFVSLICDADLSDLDQVVNAAEQAHGEIKEDIQSVRNWCGFLSDYIVEHYNKVKPGVTEGVAVIWYVDKCFVSSCYGDLMTHTKCAIELYSILNMLPHI